MQIVFSTYDSLGNPYYGGGGAVAVHEVAKRLAQKHEVTIVCGAFPGAEDHLLDGVSYRYIGNPKSGPKSGQLFYHFHLVRAVRSFHFDVWVESFTPPISTSFLPSFTGKPVMGLCHLLSGSNMARKYGWLPFEKIESRGLKKYKHFITLTPHAKSLLMQHNPDAHYAVIPNGIDPSFLQSEMIETSKPRFLFIGRIDTYQKGLDLLFKTLEGIERPLNWKIVMAGSGSKKDVNWLHRRIDEAESEIEYIGPVYGKEKFDLIQQSAALLMPSRYETLPLSLLEGFAMGKPLIWYDIPQLSWIPKSCGMSVPFQDCAAYGKAMLRLEDSEEFRRSCGTDAKEFSRKFDWDWVAGEYETAIMNAYGSCRES